MPIVGSVYWDPQTRKLCIDEELSKVNIDNWNTYMLGFGMTVDVR